MTSLKGGKLKKHNNLDMASPEFPKDIHFNQNNDRGDTLPSILDSTPACSNLTL